MKIRVNGVEKEIEAGTTVESFLNMLEIKVQGIAVDINREIVPKRLFAETILNEGDSIEIVRMVGGG